MGYVVANPGKGDQLSSSPANRLFVDATHIGQALGPLRGMDAERLESFLPTHGFGPDAAKLLRSDNRTGLIRARLAALIRGERDFMEARGVKPPTEQTAATVADSEASDDE